MTGKQGARIMRAVQPPRKIRSINPANGQELASFDALEPSEIDQRIGRSFEAFQRYRRMPFSGRASVLQAVARELEERRQEWATLMSQEMGKLARGGIDEILKCARTCRFYADNAERFLADQSISDPEAKAFVAFEPLGPILAIMPWNFPFWQVIRFAAPALMAGNSILLKHASNVPHCALAIERIFREAGLPEEVFQTLLIGSSQVERVIEDPRIQAVTLTGSDKAGAQVAGIAGRNLKKVVLELGGSDPFIIMPSVDLDHGVSMAVKARTVNNGESCVAAKRFIVHERIADSFEEKFSAAMSRLRVGDPLDPATEIGPLATDEIRDRLARQVDETIRSGGRALTGGHPIAGPGNFFEPTVLVSIARGSTAWREEFFGPVALVFRARDLNEAIRIANDNPYGLGASLWSKDSSEQETFVREIAAGMAFVNAQVASDPSRPFGGIKRSGHGRELGEFGIREFVNIKTVYIHADRQGEGTGTE